LQVPIFATFHVFVKSSPGFTTVPAGIFTSRTNSRLLQPDANRPGFTVGVYCVPVAVGDLNTEGKRGFNMDCVHVGGGVAVIRLIGELVIVGLAVFVTSSAWAVCVWYMDATNVFTASVMIALASRVGASVACPPQADNTTLANKISNPKRFITDINSFRQIPLCNFIFN
jgi:hypothetical protein